MVPPHKPNPEVSVISKLQSLSLEQARTSPAKNHFVYLLKTHPCFTCPCSKTPAQLFSSSLLLASPAQLISLLLISSPLLFWHIAVIPHQIGENQWRIFFSDFIFLFLILFLNHIFSSPSALLPFCLLNF